MAFHFQRGKTEFEIVPAKFLTETSAESKLSGSTVVSPMPGICDKILVKAGDKIEANTPVAVIIAMKMEYVLRAPRNCVVKSITSQLGKNVAKGEVIVTFREENETETTENKN